jgi:hypothetical protein
MTRRRPVTVDDVRTLALALPEATEAPHFEAASFRIRGKIFATIPPSDDRVHVFVPAEVTAAFVNDRPEAFAELWWGKKLYGVVATLDAVDRDELEELLDVAWRAKAPKRLGQATRPGA